MKLTHMKFIKLLYFFNLPIFLLSVTGYIVATDLTMQEDDIIFNSFKQLSGDIYRYTRKPLHGGLSNNTQSVCTVNERRTLCAH